jgi:feruloyl esterase
MNALTRRTGLIAGVSAGILAYASIGVAAPADPSCADLAHTAVPHSQITATSVETAGAVSICRVTVRAHPTSDSDIGIEVWIPMGDAWNGKFVQAGNGGFAGKVPSSQLKQLAAEGYVAAGTDDGHETPTNATAEWALGHPEKVVDYGWRSLKETTEAAKVLIKAAKSKAADKSYFDGCSDGGREALMEAQRYPDDFDGIVAGAPGNYQVKLVAFRSAFYRVVTRPGGYLDMPQLSLIQNATQAACGDKDAGFIRDPESCHFDPASLLCKPGQSGNGCLTQPQLDSIRAIDSGWHDPRTGDVYYPGLAPGAEAMPGWKATVLGNSADTLPTTAFAYLYASNFLRDIAFSNPNYDVTTLDLGQPAKDVVAKYGAIIDSESPDLSAFRKHGGKLIQYQGWNDQNIPSTSSIIYYQNVQHQMGNTADFYRLYMIPGMMHCTGGIGPSSVDWLATLDDWRVKAKAPAAIAATLKLSDRQKQSMPMPPHPAQSQLLCPYPQHARLTGKDSSVAESYQCR